MRRDRMPEFQEASENMIFCPAKVRHLGATGRPAEHRDESHHKQHGDGMEAEVTAGRIAAGEMPERRGGAVFAPLVMGGAGGLCAGGPPAERLARWLDGMGSATLKAMLRPDDIEAWAARAETVMIPLSGRTSPALLASRTEWPLISAPMAEALTGASRAAIQRNLAWMEAHGLIREVTGQGRFRIWRAAV